MADEALIAEAVRRGLIKPDEAKTMLGPAVAEPGLSDRLMDAGKGIAESVGSMGTGIAHGLAATIGMPGDIWNMAAPWLAKKAGLGEPPRAGGTEDVKQAFGDLTGLELHKPEGTLDKTISSAASGVVGMLPINKGQAVLGALSGAGGELADTFAGKDQPFARIAGTLAPLLLGTGSLFRPAKSRALGDAIEEVGGEAGLADAARKKALTDAMLGVNTNVSHQFPQSKALPQEVAGIQASSEGHDILTNQMEAEKAAMRSKAADMAAKIQGAQAPTQEVANATLAAGNQARSAPMQATRLAEAPLYKAAFNDTIPNLDEITSSLLQQAHERNLVGTAGMAPITSVLNRLDKMAEAAQGMPRVGQVDRLAREAGIAVTAGSKEAAAPAAAQKVLGNEIVRDVLSQSIKAASPAMASAKIIGTTGRDVADEVAKGPLGIAFPPGAVDKGIGNWDNMTKLFKVPLSPEEIASTAARLNKADPEALPTLFKKHIDDTINSGGNIGEAAAKLAGDTSSVTGKAQRASFEAWMKQTHLAGGASEAEAASIAAMNSKLMDEIQKVAAGHKTLDRPMNIGAGARAEDSMLGTVTKVLNPTGGPRSWFAVDVGDYRLKQKTFRQLAEAFAEPGNTQTLIDIARWSPGKNAAQVLGQLGRAGFITLESN